MPQYDTNRQAANNPPKMACTDEMKDTSASWNMIRAIIINPSCHKRGPFCVGKVEHGTQFGIGCTPLGVGGGSTGRLIQTRIEDIYFITLSQRSERDRLSAFVERLCKVSRVVSPGALRDIFIPSIRDLRWRRFHFLRTTLLHKPVLYCKTTRPVKEVRTQVCNFVAN